MTLLTLGILLFALGHFIPSLTPALRVKAVNRMGENGYKGLFSLLLLTSFGLIIVGWRSVEPSALYSPPYSLHTFALSLLIIAFLLLVVSSRRSRLRRWIRHPQLSAVALWGVAHLLLNGDNRAVVLFGGMSLWAIAEIIAISKREGPWIKAEPPAWSTELVSVLITAVVIVVVIFVHPWLSGMPVW